jgi:uncharacterized membrane protein HdeD (DUF308 family)
MKRNSFVNQSSRTTTSAPFVSNSQFLNARAGWIIAFGVLFVVLGVMALTSIVTSTIISVYFVAIAMIIAGATEIVMGLQSRSWSGFFWWVLLGTFYTATGIFALFDPLLAAGALTFWLSVSLIFTGVARIILAFQMRERSAWTWVVVSGFITMTLGFAIFSQWPFSSLYILGVFLSADLLFAGVSWVYLGTFLRREIIT